LQTIVTEGGAECVESNECFHCSDDYDRVRKNVTTFFFLSFSLSSIHISFHRLARMNWKWEKLSIDAKKIMKERCIVLLREGTVLDLSSLLDAFLVAEYSWKEDDTVKQAIFTGIIKNLGKVVEKMPGSIDGKGIANLIYSLAKSKISWKVIRKDVQDSLFNGLSRCKYTSLSKQDMSNVFKG
jgi:hypothetical protein